MDDIGARPSSNSPGEAVPDSLRLIACPSVFSFEHERIDVCRPAGGSVADLLRSIGWIPGTLHALVTIDGELVREAEWEWKIPRAQQSLFVRAIPQGGNGQGKDTIRLVAMIGVIAAAIAAPYALAGLGVTGLTIAGGGLTPLGGFVAASASLAMPLGINTLLPPRPKEEGSHA